MLIKRIVIALMIVAFASTAYASCQKPGHGVVVKPARAAWSTGHFHGALIIKGLEELGYKVEQPVELTVPRFFEAAMSGEVDYWPNGWFPLHDPYMLATQNVEPVGYILHQEAIQGYAVDKKHAELLNIKSLDDFKRPEVIKAFDRNNDGKADFTNAPMGWATSTAIKAHIKAYGLQDHINIISAPYHQAMAENLKATREGESAFFYCWTPSWVVYKFVPGKDIMWINVPYNIPPKGSTYGKKDMTLSEVQGAVTDPIKLGFSVSDIRVVANSNFLKKNPAARKFLEVFSMPVCDLCQQYVDLVQGKGSQKDIDQQADAWIEDNQDTWNDWLSRARFAAHE